MYRDNTVVLRTFPSEVEANIAASIIESQGIETHIQKDDCGGAYPSLQMVGGVRLLVKPEDLEEAERILKDMEAEDSSDVEPQEPQEDRKGSKSNRVLLFGLFLLGLAAGYFLSPELADRGTYTGVKKTDRNALGKPGRFYYYVKGQLVRIEEDRNYDGKPDAWHKNVAGKAHTTEQDNNFDGKPDTWAEFKDEFNYVQKVDTDFDGKPDATVYYVNGLKQRVDWHPNDSAIIERRQLYEHEVLKEELVDTDGDGIFDIKITYDSYERQISKAKCWIPSSMTKYCHDNK